MVEQKFSLELTKNGIQQVIYAKEGERKARKLKITLTVKGEVIPLTDYAITAYFDDGTQLPVTPAENPVTFEIPAGLCTEPGERIVELKFTRNWETAPGNNESSEVYSPQFRVIVEQTIGATAEGGAIGDPTQFEKLLADNDVIDYLSEGQYVPIVESDVTKLISADYFGTASDISTINAALALKADSSTVTAALALKADASDVSSLGGRVTEAEGDISDIETALDSKADTSTVNTALAGKVDKVSGKGLSTNDYDATEKANVASNTSARHTHSNKSVLDKFGESSGTPTYDGNPIGGGGGTITDVQDSDGNSLVSDGIAVIPTGEMLEIVESAEQGVVISKYSRSEIYDLYAEGKALCCQGFPISTVVRGDNYYLYFISGGYNDTPYLSRREVKSDKTITTAQLVGYFTEREYTAAKDTKLSGIATGAEVNVIDTIKDSNGNPLTVTSKSVTLPASSQVQVDYAQSNSSAVDYIKNKPDLSVYALSANLGAVATSNDYDDLDNKPTIPDISGKEDTANKVTSLSSSSTDTEYPSAKCVYDELQNIPSMPSGTNAGDILVWNGDEWVSKPKWQMIYQPVEYIETTGTQRIRTGIFAGPTTRLVADMQFTEQPSSNNSFLNGSTNGTWGFIWGWDGATSKFQTLVNSSYQWVQATQGDTNRHTWDLANGSQKIDNVEYSTTSMTSVSTSYDITFGSRNSGGNFNTPSKARYHSVKIYDGNTLIRDFIPAYNVYTGEAGCYEAVEQKFYSNDGSGKFILGPEI